MSFSSIEELPLGKILQSVQGTGLGKKRKKKLSNSGSALEAIRKKGPPNATKSR